MYVKRLHLYRVKCFSDFTLEFPDPPTGDRTGGWYVIVGANGMGKSTILRAIALALGMDRVWVEHLYEWAGAPEGMDLIRLHAVLPYTPGGSGPQVHVLTVPAWTIQRSNAQRIFKEALEVGGGVVMAGYGAFRRVRAAQGGGGRRRGDDRGFASLLDDDAPLDATHWLLEAESRSRVNDGTAAQPYQQLVSGLPSLVGNIVPCGFRMLPASPEGVRFEDPFGKPVGLSNLGDGYRSIVGLVLCLLRDLVGWEPGDPETGALGSLGDGTGNVDDAAHTPGVVLIDEPDAHLHPSWQREIGFALQRVFPNIQFIVATHSPFICQAASPGGIFRLRMNEEEKRIEAVQPVEDTVRGWHIQDIYREALGLDNWLDMQTAADLEEYQHLAAAERAGPLSPDDATELGDLRERLRDVLAAPGQTPEWREEYRRLRKLRERLEAKVGGGDG
jgi:hypothetical protein